VSIRLTEKTIATTVWVTADAPNELIGLKTKRRQDASVSLMLSDWDKQVSATTPPV
jgi:LppX_LprAFG lipoprotein